MCRLPAPQKRYLDYPTALARGWPIATGSRGLPPSGERSVRYHGSAVGVGGVRGGLETSRSVEQWRLGGLLGVSSGPRTATGPCCAVRGRDSPRRRLMAATAFQAQGHSEAVSPTFWERCESILPFGARPPPPSGGVRSWGSTSCSVTGVAGRSRCARLLFPCLTKPSSGHVPGGDRGDGRRPTVYSRRSHEARRSRGWVLPMPRVRLHGFRALVGVAHPNALRRYAILSAPSQRSSVPSCIHIAGSRPNLTVYATMLTNFNAPGAIRRRPTRVRDTPQPRSRGWVRTAVTQPTQDDKTNGQTICGAQCIRTIGFSFFRPMRIYVFISKRATSYRSCRVVSASPTRPLSAGMLSASAAKSPPKRVLRSAAVRPEALP